jgi:hypothetical protein
VGRGTASTRGVEADHLRSVLVREPFELAHIIGGDVRRNDDGDRAHRSEPIARDAEVLGADDR